MSEKTAGGLHWNEAATIIAAVAALFSALAALNAQPRIAWILIILVFAIVSITLTPAVSRSVQRRRLNSAAGKLWPDYLRLVDEFQKRISKQRTDTLIHALSQISHGEALKLCPPDFLPEIIENLKIRNSEASVHTKQALVNATFELQNLIRTYNQHYVGPALEGLRGSEWETKVKDHRDRINEMSDDWRDFLINAEKFIEEVSRRLCVQVGMRFERPKKI